MWHQMRGGCDAANHRKNLQSTIVALDGPLPNGCKGGALPDMSGDNRIHQYLRVLRQIAKPRCQIDDVSDRRVVEASVPAERSDGRRSHRDTHAETNGAQSRAFQ